MGKDSQKMKMSSVWDGKEFFICGYSLSGFIDDPEERKKEDKKFKYIYKNCKDWSFFGDGLYFTCNCKEDECPFEKFFENNPDYA